MEAKLKEPILGVTENLIPAVFHAIVTLSARVGHLPLEGKAAIPPAGETIRPRIVILSGEKRPMCENPQPEQVGTESKDLMPHM